MWNELVCAKIWDFTRQIVCFSRILTSQCSDRFRFLSLKVFEIFMFKLCLRFQRAKNGLNVHLISLVLRLMLLVLAYIIACKTHHAQLYKFKAWPVDAVQHATHVTLLSSAASYWPVSHGSMFHLQRRQSPNDETQHEMCVQYTDWCTKSVCLCLCLFVLTEQMSSHNKAGNRKWWKAR